MKDLNKYKTEISLPDFLVSHFGFQESEDKSTHSNPRLENRETGEVFVIKKNNAGFYTYWSPYDSETKGKTILDFMQQRLKKGDKVPSLYEVAQVLDNYISSGKIIKAEDSIFRLSGKKHDISRLGNEIKPLTSNYFFQQRGISDSMLESRAFKGVFGEREYIDNKNGNVYKNIVVKLFNKEGLAGLSQRNLHFKGCLVSRCEALAATNPDLTLPLDAFYISESMIDNMSHYELNYDILKEKNIEYFSSEGGLTLGQIGLLQQAVDHIKPAKLISLYDRDIAGQCFTLNLFGNIIFNGAGEGIRLKLTDNIKQNYIICEFVMSEDSAKEKNNNFKKSFFSERMNGEVDIRSYRSEGKVIWSFRFPRTLDNVMEFINKTKEFRLGQAPVSQEIPLTNDFNDDIRAFKGIHKEWEIKKFHGKFVGVKTERKENALRFGI